MNNINQIESYEENNPPDISIDEFLSLLHHYWKDLQKQDIKFHYHGTYNVFFIQINDKSEYILRISDQDLRNFNGVALLHSEKEVLKTLQKVWLKFKSQTYSHLFRQQPLENIITSTSLYSS